MGLDLSGARRRVVSSAGEGDISKEMVRGQVIWFAVDEHVENYQKNPSFDPTDRVVVDVLVATGDFEGTRGKFVCYGNLAFQMVRNHVPGTNSVGRVIAGEDIVPGARWWGLDPVTPEEETEAEQVLILALDPGAAAAVPIAKAEPVKVAAGSKPPPF